MKILDEVSYNDVDLGPKSYIIYLNNSYKSKILGTAAKHFDNCNELTMTGLNGDKSLLHFTDDENIKVYKFKHYGTTKQ